MRKLLAVVAATSLLAACEGKTKAPAPAPAATGSAAQPEKKAKKVTRLAKNTASAKATAGKARDRDARGEESTGSTPIILMQSPPPSN